MAVANLTDKQIEALRGRFDPSLAQGDLPGVLASLIAGVNGKVNVAVVAGTNAAPLSGITDAATVIAVLAITTSTGAAAAKLLQAVTTDYTVSGGVITTVGDKSALTLIVIYRT